MSAASAANASAATPRRRSTWPIAIMILGVACIAQGAFWIRYRDDATYSKMSVLFVWPAAIFALLVWWTFFSRLSWRTRLSGLGLLLLACVSFFSVYRIEGSDGDMIPKLSYRWEPTAAEKAREFWSVQKIAPPRTSEVQAVEAPASIDDAEFVAGPDDSTDFRGNERDGILRGQGFRKDWDARPPKELWRHPLGLGWSSFAVLGDRAITMEQRDENECVVAYSLKTGDVQWLHADAVRFRQVAVNGGDGPHATPVIVGNRTYSQGATGLLNCLDTRTGRREWQRNILEDAGANGQPAENIQWGISGSPCVVDDLVIVIAGGKIGEDFTGKSVIAYDRHTGDIRWASGKFPASYAGARVEEFLGTRQVLAFHGTGISSLALDTGKLLWEEEWKNDPSVNAAQPIKLDDRSLLIGSGYGTGSARIELSLNGDAWSDTMTWKSPRLKLKFNDAVIRDGHVYGLDDGILTCLDVASGKLKWKGGRYGYGQILLHDDTLLVLTEEGDVTLAAAEPTKFRELHRIPALTGTTWNHPVVAHGKLLVRNGVEVVCFDVAP
jgi:outer membrane protein assembly factor BamB